MLRVMLAISIVAAVATDPPARLSGSVRTHAVQVTETMATIAARAGIEIRTLASDNDISATAPLRVGQSLVVDNRHIAPGGYTDGVVLNVAQRMLFVFADGEAVRAFPAAVGRPDWRTPLGDFTIAVKELDPVWDVPPSIQREMARNGRRVVSHVHAGPANPLGRHWLGLSIPGVGIHGTNQPASIYRFTTHGCVRLHPDDVAELFELVEVGTRVLVIYEPVLLATEGVDTFLEVHPDPYRKLRSVTDRVAELMRDARLDHLIRSAPIERIVAERAGRAVRVLPVIEKTDDDNH